MVSGTASETKAAVQNSPAPRYTIPFTVTLSSSFSDLYCSTPNEPGAKHFAQLSDNLLYFLIEQKFNRSCTELLENGDNSSGVYTINPDAANQYKCCVT